MFGSKKKRKMNTRGPTPHIHGAMKLPSFLTLPISAPTTITILLNSGLIIPFHFFMALLPMEVSIKKYMWFSLTFFNFI